ncbi:Reverse transcriptase domain-containing protein [Aphis craccivora]|uniref:Reverse transcriptase domain-containing protein n=1 Tax=Aphis craccivora TaxID=307492 RepID=A0A6G0Z9G3_APHCR|nr:Reverse transcriptase domain-containing protein [Aphis craccivora]
MCESDYESVNNSDPLFLILNSFLTNLITKFVKYNNFISDSISVISCVPQRDPLFPLLFNLFVNDIVFSIKYSNIPLDKKRIKADEAKIYKFISNTADAELLQYDSTNFQNWCILNARRTKDFDVCEDIGLVFAICIDVLMSAVVGTG